MEEGGERSRSPYRVVLGLDLGLMAGALVVLGLPHLLDDAFGPPWCGLDCDRSDINRLDRTVVGNHSAVAGTISDAGRYSAVALPFVLGAVDVLASDPADGWEGYGKDALVVAETLAVTGGITMLLKATFDRPRPLVYDDEHFTDDERLGGNAACSFPSGHTATAFAAATAASYTFELRHPDSPWRYPVWLGSYALAATTGVMRTEAGKHFWTDVIAGASLGAGLGLLIPWLHRRDDPAGPSLTPMALPGGAGACLTIR